MYLAIDYSVYVFNFFFQTKRITVNELLLIKQQIVILIGMKMKIPV